jgi:hypothetical protein
MASRPVPSACDRAPGRAPPGRRRPRPCRGSGPGRGRAGPDPRLSPRRRSWPSAATACGGNPRVSGLPCRGSWPLSCAVSPGSHPFPQSNGLPVPGGASPAPSGTPWAIRPGSRPGSRKARARGSRAPSPSPDPPEPPGREVPGTRTGRTRGIALPGPGLRSPISAACLRGSPCGGRCAPCPAWEFQTPRVRDGDVRPGGIRGVAWPVPAPAPVIREPETAGVPEGVRESPLRARPDVRSIKSFRFRPGYMRDTDALSAISMPQVLDIASQGLRRRPAADARRQPPCQKQPFRKGCLVSGNISRAFPRSGTCRFPERHPYGCPASRSSTHEHDHNHDSILIMLYYI